MPKQPSPYLISKLRNYEEFHKRCGPNSRAYKIAMQKITTLSSKTHHHQHHHNDNVDAAKCKYLVWTPANGLGNRMISIAAAFLFAVLTDRVLLVRFEADMNGLFCEPFHGSTWILPMNSPFWNHENVETYQSIVLAKVDKARNLTLDQLLLPYVLFINLQHTKEDPEIFFHCDHNQEALKKVIVLIVQSDQYFVPSLFMTPSFSHDMNKMFLEKDAVFHHVGRYLFHPSNEAWGQISKFYDAYLAKADERIGLQIRVFRPTFTPQQAVMDLLLSCATSNKILPEVDTRNPAGTTASNVGRNNHTLKAVVVASLYPEYGENLRSMYLKGPTITGEVIRVYQPSHEEKQKFNDNVHNIKALVDMYLLSLCDVLVTSSLSTFGYVAQGFGGLKPWLLYGLVSNETHFPPCLRDLSPEPCYHFPPQRQCNGNPKEHFATSFPHMFECKDYYRGVKLGDGVYLFTFFLLLNYKPIMSLKIHKFITLLLKHLFLSINSMSRFTQGFTGRCISFPSLSFFPSSRLGFRNFAQVFKFNSISSFTSNFILFMFDKSFQFMQTEGLFGKIGIQRASLLYSVLHRAKILDIGKLYFLSLKFDKSFKNTPNFRFASNIPRTANFSKNLRPIQQQFHKNNPQHKQIKHRTKNILYPKYYYLGLKR
ncbi:hypothetical protein Ahy_B05g078731 isoform D [Arachis hypogaea]|uniref:Fucosyltransferase n=1 Tax=Arachis hypogaea TaxID=3818 RepID=A0A444Z7X3_ARAHY|nr:hypothetical protein Ahy_B05g078731 isoform D [Arachis hypogaea]